MASFDFSILEPERSTTVDPLEFLRTAMAWHFGEETGSKFWLDRKAQLGFDPVTEIQTYEDLGKFPNLTGDHRNVAVEDLIPRGYGPNPPTPIVFETGGTTGAPGRVIWMPEWIEFWMDEHVKIYADPAYDGNVLNVFPTGPHGTGVLPSLAAQRAGKLFFTIDMDPRWVKALIGRGEIDQANAYAKHIIQQATYILESQTIGQLSLTPPLLALMVEEDHLCDLIRAKVKKIFWSGTHMTQDERVEYEQEYFPGIEFSTIYGSTMQLQCLFPRTGTSADEDIILDLQGPWSRITVVDPETLEPVEYGESGQVVMDHISKAMFIPSNLERDTVVRVPGQEGSVGDSIAAPKPVAAVGDKEVIEGVY